MARQTYPLINLETRFTAKPNLHHEYVSLMRINIKAIRFAAAATRPMEGENVRQK